MGGAVSAGENNDELIDNLVQANYIRSKDVEEIFRAVDRGEYYLDSDRDTAYHDLAWKHEHLHISAPCIYSEVMSSLQLQEGLSFLNIGSGTGYLSTLVGLALGTNGINHGIEVHCEVVEYARKNIKHFISSSHAFDKYNFCEPEFVIGNCLNISLEEPSYDRIYCGAACPGNYVGFIKSLLNINGILILPLNDKLSLIKRTGQSSWDCKNILDVNFAGLILPVENESNVKLPKRNAVSLKSLCRSCIRLVLIKKHNNTSNRRHKKKVKQALEFSSSEDDSSDGDEVERGNDVSGERSIASNKTPGCSSILNVSSGTVTMVTDAERELPPPPRNNCGNNTEAGRSEETRTSSSGRRRMQRTSLSRFLSKKSRSGKSGNGGNLKRMKHGCMPFLRRKKKRSKTCENEEDEEMVEDVEESGSREVGEGSSGRRGSPDPEARGHLLENPPMWMLENENSSRAIAYSERQGRENGIGIFFSSDVRTLRSFLVDMTNRISETVVPVAHAYSPPLSRGHVVMDERERHVIRKYEMVEETPNQFRHAVLKLPVPDQIKDYILFYRSQ